MLLCVSFGLTNQVWNYLEFCLSKTYFVFECLKGEWLKILILGKLGFKTCVLEKHFFSYSCIFISYIQCFEVCFQNSSCFSKTMFFFFFLIDPTWFSINRNPFEKFKWASIWFDWSNLFFDQSNIVNQVFLKTQFWLVQTSFKNFSKVFFSLSPTRQGSTKIFFLSFFSKILAKFLSP